MYDRIGWLVVCQSRLFYRSPKFAFPLLAVELSTRTLRQIGTLSMAESESEGGTDTDTDTGNDTKPASDRELFHLISDGTVIMLIRVITVIMDGYYGYYGCYGF